MVMLVLPRGRDERVLVTAYVTKAWCGVCQAKTVQNRVTLPDPQGQHPTQFTVCAECEEQVGADAPGPGAGAVARRR